MLTNFVLRVFRVNSIKLKEKYITGKFLLRIALNQSNKASSTSSNFTIRRRFLFGSNVDVSKALKIRIGSCPWVMSDKVELAMPNSFAILPFAPF